MSFLSRLFKGKAEELADKGIYFFVRCGNCRRVLRVRLDPDIDLNRVPSGYEVRKTLVDDRCFRPFALTATFDGKRKLITAEAEGGELIEQAEWSAEKDLPRRLSAADNEEDA